MAGLQIWIDRFWQDLQPTPSFHRECVGRFMVVSQLGFAS